MDDIEGSLDGFCRTPHLPDWAVIGRAALQLDGSGVILWAHCGPCHQGVCSVGFYRGVFKHPHDRTSFAHCPLDCCALGISRLVCSGVP